MNSGGITAESMLRVLPDVLANDETMRAFCKVLADEFVRITEETIHTIIYNRLDDLPEEMLDILAYDFKVDWWDGDYTLAEKQRTLKDSWRVHRMMGTKAAVETAISAIYPDTKVLEWFEYDGEPYHFKLEIDASYEGTDTERHKRILDRVNFYKNLRSHLDGADYIVTTPETAMAYVGAAAMGQYMSFGVELKVEGLEHPHTNINLHTGAKSAGMRMDTGAEVSFDADMFRRSNVTMSAAAAHAGEFMKIYSEVNLNGMG